MLKKMKKEKEEKKTKSACLHMVPSRAILRPGIVMVVFSSLLPSILLDGYFMNSCIWSFVSLFYSDLDAMQAEEQRILGGNVLEDSQRRRQTSACQDGSHVAS